MAKTIQDIQAVIEKRATLKLNTDLQSLCNSMNNIELLRYNGDHLAERPKAFLKVRDGQSEKFQDYEIPSMFHVSTNDRDGRFSGSILMTKLHDYWLPVYIERETKSFFDRLDQVEQQVSDLVDARNNSDEY
jgi:hypothetical protein